MNPELQAKLVQYLDGLEKGAAKVGEFAEREIPETIREWLLWLAVERFTYAAALLISATVLIVLLRRLHAAIPGWTAKDIENEKKRFPMIYRDREPTASDASCEVYWLLATAGWCLAAVLAIVGGWQALQGVKVLVSPRVVIVEKVAELCGHK